MTPNGCHMVLQKSAVDEVHKNDNLHDEFNIDLEYILPAKGDLITEDDHKTHHHANHGAKKKLKKFGSMKKPKSMRKKKRTGNKTMPTTPRHSSARDLTIEMDDLMFSDVPTVEMASQSNSATPQQLQSPTSKPQESLDFDLFS
jgi:hypothetical protein